MTETEVITLTDQDIERLREMDRQLRNLQAPTDSSPGSRTQKDSIPVLNRSGVDIPQFGCGWIQENETNYAQRKALRPTRACHTSIMIAATPIPIGEPGRMWYTGAPRCRVSDWATLQIGDRIGTWPDSFDQRGNDAGPMLVIAKEDDPIVRAIFLRRRQGAIFIRDVAETVQKDMEHVHFATGWIVSAPNAWTARIELRS